MKTKVHDKIKRKDWVLRQAGNGECQEKHHEWEYHNGFSFLVTYICTRCGEKRTWAD